MRRKFRTVRTAFLLVLAAATAVFMTPSTAWAIQPWEINDATSTPITGEPTGCNAWAHLTGPSGDTIFDACFVKLDDILVVFDLNTQPGNGFGWMQWQNDLKDKNGNWVPYRHGECWLRESVFIAGYCNKNFYENSTPNNAAGGQGSRIGFKACSSDSRYGCSTLTWVTNNG